MLADPSLLQLFSVLFLFLPCRRRPSGQSSSPPPPVPKICMIPYHPLLFPLFPPHPPTPRVEEEEGDHKCRIRRSRSKELQLISVISNMCHNSGAKKGGKFSLQYCHCSFLFRFWYSRQCPCCRSFPFSIQPGLTRKPKRDVTIIIPTLHSRTEKPIASIGKFPAYLKRSPPARFTHFQRGAK